MNNPHETLKKWIDDSDITQAEIADELGVSQPTVNSQLTGRNSLSIEVCIKAVEILGRDPYWDAWDLMVEQLSDEFVESMDELAEESEEIQQRREEAPVEVV